MTLRARAISRVQILCASWSRPVEEKTSGPVLPAGVDGDVCDRQIDSLRKTLHGRKRLEMRMAATGYTSWVEQIRERGQTGKVIKAVLRVYAGRKHQDGLYMDTRRFRLEKSQATRPWSKQR